MEGVGASWWDSAADYTEVCVPGVRFHGRENLRTGRFADEETCLLAVRLCVLQGALLQETLSHFLS